MDAFNGVGNGDFSQSLVRHKALTARCAQSGEAVSWRESATDDTGIDANNLVSVCDMCVLVSTGLL